MKITGIRVIVTCPGRNYVLVKVLTNEGLYGLGDATLNGREMAVVEVIREYLEPWLVGQNPDNIEDIWQQIFRGTYWRGGPVLMTALSGIDMALWDIKGKRAGLPVYSLLGGRSREKVRTYLHAFGSNFKETLECCQQRIKQECTALRVSVDISHPSGKFIMPQPRLEGALFNEGVKSFQQGKKPTEGRWDSSLYLRKIPQFIAFLRKNLGEEVDLIYDIHERISPIQAVQLAKELEPYKLFFFVFSLRPEHNDSLRLLRSQTSIPIAVGELYFTKWDCLPLIKEQLVDFVRVDLSHCGGITEGRKIAAMAEPYYINMAFHGPSDLSPIGHAANVHLDLSIPNFGIQEFALPSWNSIKEVFIGGPEYKDGYLFAPDKPGLGVDINEKAAKKYRYKRAYIPTLRQLDGSVQDW